jgi:Ca2+/Na+ antiporter
VNPAAGIALLAVCALYVAFLFSRGQRREAPDDDPDPPQPLPKATIKR